MDEPELRSLLVQRLGKRQLIALDASVALAYTFVMTVLTTRSNSADTAPLPVELLVVGLIGLPLAVRRWRPGAVFALTLSMTILARFLRLPGDAFVAAAFALYPFALAQPHRRWIPTSLIGAFSAFLLLAGPLAGPRDGEATEIGNLLFGLAVMGASWTLGRALRERREHAARSARQLAERAVTDERLRIARELHDVVAHSMSLIAVKAGVAVHVAEARPQETLDALRVIEKTSRDALIEMRHLLGVLRTPTSPAQSERPLLGGSTPPGQTSTPSHPTALDAAAPPPPWTTAQSASPSDTHPEERDQPKQPRQPGERSNPERRGQPQGHEPNRPDVPKLPAAVSPPEPPRQSNEPPEPNRPKQPPQPEGRRKQQEPPHPQKATHLKPRPPSEDAPAPNQPAHQQEWVQSGEPHPQKSESAFQPSFRPSFQPSSEDPPQPYRPEEQPRSRLAANPAEPKKSKQPRQPEESEAPRRPWTRRRLWRQTEPRVVSRGNPQPPAPQQRMTEQSAIQIPGHTPGVSRDPNVPAPSKDELTPMPGLAGLNGLVEAAAMAGVRVDLRLHAGELPEGVALAVYRIVQEALTNMVKHAAPARGRVAIEQAPGEVRIEVTDDGPGVRVLPTATPGHGLIGMRERAMMYGGELTAGPRPEGGFAVSARLPYDRSAR